MLTAKEIAREILDALEQDNGTLFGDVTMKKTLEAVIQQAIDFGWDVYAEDVIALAIGDEMDQRRIVEKNPALAVVDAQLKFIFNQPARD